MAAAASDGPAKHEHHIESDTTQNGCEDPEKAVPLGNATDEESGTGSPQPDSKLQRWNDTPLNTFRYFTTIYCFILMGLTDGALGVCLLSQPE